MCKRLPTVLDGCSLFFIKMGRHFLEINRIGTFFAIVVVSLILTHPIQDQSFLSSPKYSSKALCPTELDLDLQLGKS